MKFLFLTATFLLASTTFASTVITRNKDNMDAYCRVKADVGFRSYKIELRSEKVMEDARELELEVSLFKCVEVENGFAFKRSFPGEILHNYIILNDGTLGVTDNKLVSVNFSLVKADGAKFNTLSINSADDTDTMLVKLSVKKDITKVYMLAEFTSNISSPIGSIEGLVQRYGGYVLSFE